MDKFLVVASHWSVPGIRQTLCHTPEAAAAQSVEYVNDLIADFVKDSRAGVTADLAALDVDVPMAVEPGGDWEHALRMLRYARLVDLMGEKDYADEQLIEYSRDGMLSHDELVLPLDLSNSEHARLLDDYVDDQVHEADGDSYPCVWIETVPERQAEQLEKAAEPGEALKTVLLMAERFLAEGDVADESPAMRARYQAALDAVKAAPAAPDLSEPEQKLLGRVLHYADSFVVDWVETADKASKADAAEAAAIVHAARHVLYRIAPAGDFDASPVTDEFTMVPRHAGLPVSTALRNARAALGACLEEISEARGLFDENDGEGTEAVVEAAAAAVAEIEGAEAAVQGHWGIVPVLNEGKDNG